MRWRHPKPVSREKSVPEAPIDVRLRGMSAHLSGQKSGRPPVPISGVSRALKAPYKAYPQTRTRLRRATEGVVKSGVRGDQLPFDANLLTTPKCFGGRPLVLLRVSQRMGFDDPDNTWGELKARALRMFANNLEKISVHVAYCHLVCEAQLTENRHSGGGGSCCAEVVSASFSR